MSDFPEFQHKPKKKPNYHERCKLGLQKGGLRKASEKKKEKLKEYRKAINSEVEQPCIKCGSTFNLTRHHYKGQKFITEYIILCQSCHDFIHANSRWAKEVGWLFSEYSGLPTNPNQPIPWQ